jgi:hypothetical protein
MTAYGGQNLAGFHRRSGVSPGPGIMQLSKEKLPLSTVEVNVIAGERLFAGLHMP